MRKKPYGRRNKIASSCPVSLGAPKQAQFAREKREGNHHQEAPRGAAPAGSRKHRRILRAYQTNRRRLEDRTTGGRIARFARLEVGTGKERAVVLDGAVGEAALVPSAEYALGGACTEFIQAFGRNRLGLQVFAYETGL